MLALASGPAHLCEGGIRAEDSGVLLVEDGCQYYILSDTR